MAEVDADTGQAGTEEAGQADRTSGQAHEETTRARQDAASGHVTEDLQVTMHKLRFCKTGCRIWDALPRYNGQ